MLNVFETDDGMFHQAVLSLNKSMLIRLVVEKLPLKGDPAAEWEWMVWRSARTWDEETVPVSGRETSLNTAKRQAFDAAVMMLSNLTRDRAIGLPAFLAMPLNPHWRGNLSNAQH